MRNIFNNALPNDCKSIQLTLPGKKVYNLTLENSRKKCVFNVEYCSGG